jgi:hypothetical protein
LCKNTKYNFRPNHRVRTGPGKPGKSWNFNIPKSRPGNPGKSVMESHGKLKFYITLTKYFTYSIYQS